MASKVIMEGDKIEFKEILNAEQKEAGKKADVYVSQVFEFTDDDTLKVAMPIFQGRLVPLTKDKRYDAYFYTSRGLYYARVIILDRYKSGNIYGMEIEFRSELTKFQRRQFFRLDKALPVSFCNINDDQYQEILETKQLPESLKDASVYKTGTSVDISGGGMRFISTTQVQSGSHILIVFEVEIGARKIVFKLPSYVIRCTNVQNRYDRFEFRIEYENISKEYREILVKYIFEEERKSRKGGR